MMENLIKPGYEQLIFQFRGMKVMVDSDLAVVYGTTTKALKQQVKRNTTRFPAEVFTEQGVAMLSSVLRSEKAILVNIEIMRAFARYRSMLKENEVLKMDILKLDKKVDDIFQYLLEKIDELQEKHQIPRKRIGFRRGGD